jgi:hypothetical protein
MQNAKVCDRCGRAWPIYNVWFADTYEVGHTRAAIVVRNDETIAVRNNESDAAITQVKK